MAAVTQQEMHWRDRLIAKAAVISDSWQVALAWLGRLAEVVLFVSMILMLANIVISFPGWFVGGLLVLQMITLDVAAFGLGTMANHVKRNGNEEAAQKAEMMSNALIGIMIITALNVVINLRFGSDHQVVHTWTGYIDDVLIFVRIIAVILYGHTIRSLREVSQAIEIAKQDETDDLKNQITQLQRTLQTERRQAVDVQAQLQKDLQSVRADFTFQIEGLKQSQNMTLQTAENQSSVVNDLQNQLREALQNCNLQTAKMDQKQRVLDLQTEKLQTATTDLQTAKMQIADLQNQLQEAKLQTAKMSAVSSAKTSGGKVTSIDQARAKHEAAGSSRAKVSDEEILQFIAENPGMKVADVAAHFGVSERKVYSAKSTNTDAAVQ